jgi:hypothetical protein
MIADEDVHRHAVENLERADALFSSSSGRRVRDCSWEA